MQRRDFTRLIGTGIALDGIVRGAKPPSKRIKAAVITESGGAHLNFFFPSLAQAEEVESVAVCDATGDSERLARGILGGKLSGLYKDADAMLRAAKPGLTLVSMEAVHAPAMIEAALDAGSHVLSEKPGCVRAEDFDRLNQKAKARGLNLVLALAIRRDPWVVKARRMIEDGTIGKIYGFEAHLIADQTRLTRPAYHQTWQAQKARAGGGQLIWEGIHWADLAMHLAGSPVDSVCGFTADIGGQPLDVEDSAVVAMRLRSGVLGTLTAGYYLDRGHQSHLKIWGSQGWLHIQRDTETPLEWYTGRETPSQVHRDTAPLETSGYAYPFFVHSMARACLGLEPLPLTGDASVLALKTVFACYRAAETGKTQRVT